MIWLIYVPDSGRCVNVFFFCFSWDTNSVDTGVCRYNSYDQRGTTGSRAAPMADNSNQYDRRVDRYERHEQPASRYTERRDSHESVRRDRDDRRVAETRAPKYDR